MPSQPDKPTSRHHLTRTARDPGWLTSTFLRFVAISYVMKSRIATELLVTLASIAESVARARVPELVVVRAEPEWVDHVEGTVAGVSSWTVMNAIVEHGTPLVIRQSQSRPIHDGLTHP